MKVKIIKTSTEEWINALIKKGTISQMPSIQQGWRFNFDKELKKLSGAIGYLLVTEETSDVVEGCMIFMLNKKMIPYMAYLEIAPHNKKDKRKYDHVAGCLIAFAYQQSVIYGKDHFRGILFFDVMEENKADEIKLMALYSSKYYAKRWDGTTMVIMDEDGEALVRNYLDKTI
jgi:hypothetical protein